MYVGMYVGVCMCVYMGVCKCVCEECINYKEFNKILINVLKFHLSRELFSLRLNMLIVTVGDDSILGRWFHLFGARWRKLLFSTEFNGMGGSERVMR